MTAKFTENEVVQKISAGVYKYYGDSIPYFPQSSLDGFIAKPSFYYLIEPEKPVLIELTLNGNSFTLARIQGTDMGMVNDFLEQYQRHQITIPATLKVKVIIEITTKKDGIFLTFPGYDKAPDSVFNESNDLQVIAKSYTGSDFTKNP